MRYQIAKPLVLVAAFASLTHPLVQAQEAPASVGAPTAVIVPQPDSPLQVVSMKPLTKPERTNVPSWVAQAAVDYEMLVRNLSNEPIMAYAIRHESQGGTGRSRDCQSSLGFSGPMIGAGESKTIEAHLQKSGPTTTPVIDLVLLKNGTYFGENLCGILNDYTKRLEERRATFQTIMNLIQRDGVDKTTAWISAELARDVQPLLAPKKMK